MRKMLECKSIIAVVILGFGFPFYMQGLPDSDQVPAAPSVNPLRVPDKFTNLQVLPENIDREDLLARMNQYSGQLGVRCSFCHILNPGKAVRTLLPTPSLRSEPRG